MEKLMDTWTASLAELNNYAWQLLAEGVTSHKKPFHFGTFVNVSNGIIPEARTVILRSAKKEKLQLSLNADIRSKKIEQLRNNNNCAWLFYDEKSRMQIRCNGKATIHFGTKETEETWNNLRIESQLTYALRAMPSSHLQQPELIEMQREADAEILAFAKNNFSIVTTKVSRMELVLLSYKGNRRALFDYEQDVFTWIQV